MGAFFDRVLAWFGLKDRPSHSTHPPAMQRPRLRHPPRVVAPPPVVPIILPDDDADTPATPPPLPLPPDKEDTVRMRPLRSWKSEQARRRKERNGGR